MEIKVPFLKEKVGLGDAIAKATTAAGIKPCGGCKKRQQIANAITLVPARPDAEPLPVATIGEPYVVALPGNVVGGSIPPGIRFQPQFSILSGQPNQPGVYGLIVAVDGQHRHFKLEVR